MSEVLLLNFDPILAPRLADSLARLGHRVTVHTGHEALSMKLRRESSFDLAILDVSESSTSVRRNLIELQTYRAGHGVRPMVLCVSRVYRGPRFELELERKGARVAYVR